MFGLLVMISVVSVPILGMLAIGSRMRKRDMKKQKAAREKSEVLAIYTNQL